MLIERVRNDERVTLSIVYIRGNQRGMYVTERSGPDHGLMSKKDSNSYQQQDF